MARLTRSEWNAMSADEQWQYIDRAPFQIGEKVLVIGYTRGNLGKPVPDGVTAIINGSRQLGDRWFFDAVTDPKREDFFWHLGNWPEEAFAKLTDHA